MANLGAIAIQWHEAADHGDCETLVQLLHVRPNLIAHDSHAGWNALHAAARHGHHEAVALLLAAPGCLVNEPGPLAKTALHLAAAEGHAQVVALLLATPKIDVNARDYRGATPLHFAAQEGQVKAAELLLSDHRTLINAIDEARHTALMSAVRSEQDGVAAAILRLASSTVKIASDEGPSILRLAIVKGNDELVTLLKAKTPATEFIPWVSRSDRKGWAAFHLAIRYDRDEVVRQLLALCGPTLIDKKNQHGRNALQIAVSHGAEKSIDRFLALRPEWITCIDPKSGNTLLHLAAQSVPSLSPAYFTRFWRLRLVDPNSVNKFGITPFEFAVLKHNHYAIEVMQSKLSWDEIVFTFITCKKELPVEKLRPLIAEQCAGLLELLNQDVVGTVYEYLGFERLLTYRRGGVSSKTLTQ